MKSSMTNLPQNLIPILSSITILLMMVNKTLSRDTTSFYFDSFHSKPTDLTYQGDAHVPSSSSFLRLTKTDTNGIPRPSRVGRVLFSKPVQCWSPKKVLQFTTTIKFTITPVEEVEPADGLAFFIAPVGSAIPGGSSGGNLGLFGSRGSSAALFAVEVDLYTNPWDGIHDYHVGIDINSRYSSNAVRFDGACLEGEMTLYVTHDGRMISATLACDGGGGVSYGVEFEYDLSEFLPEMVQVGISAATGGSFAVYDVNFWSFNSSMAHVPDHAPKD